MNGLDCIGQDVSNSYDETTRTVRYTFSAGSNCSDLDEAVVFDEDGNAISWTIYSTNIPSVTTNTLEERGQICPD